VNSDYRAEMETYLRRELGPIIGDVEATNFVVDLMLTVAEAVDRQWIGMVAELKTRLLLLTVAAGDVAPGLLLALHEIDQVLTTQQDPAATQPGHGDDMHSH
jgi:hypothetical protein